MAGNLAHVALAVLVLRLPVSFRVAVVLWLVPVAVFETWFQVALYRGSGSWVHGWRGWWRFRRSFPSEWAEAAAKTRRVQSAIGGERRVSTRVRPVADHPKLAWWPDVSWPVVSAWCGHPPGRKPSAAVEFQQTIASNVLRVDDVSFLFDRSRDSVGRIRVTFVDVLRDEVEPVVADVPPGVEPVLRVVEGREAS
jgi:hypothetical protein